MMSLFKRAISLEEAVSTIRGCLEDLGSSALPPDLQDLAAKLWARDAARLELVTADPRVRAMIDAYPDPAGIIEAGCRFAAANSALDALLAGRTLGRTVLQATRSSDLNELAAHALAGAAERRELTLPALDNRPVDVALEPLASGRALLVLRDLTAVKRAEAMRRDFIANASHELRTPVSAISGAVETLMDMSLDQRALPFVEMIARQTARMSRLTSDLLDLSRLESGEWPLELGSYELLPICDAALELVKERATDKGIHLGSDVPSTLAVRADARAVEQILVNLLDNAVKYTPAGGRVTLLADAAGASVLVSVLDTGPGIETRHQQRIFERFYRVDGGRARSDGGSGLGLAIVKHLAQAQGGEVGVESGRGGSRFWVKLPAPA
jgi:two-component system phosphate regulon sensor histidine kinase PhoR